MSGSRNLRVIKTIFAMIMINIVLYLIFAFFAEKYSPIYASPVLSVDFIGQSDYGQLWQAFVWPIFAMFMGLIHGYSMRNQQKKVKWFFITFIFGLSCMISVGILLEDFFPNGATGFLKWSTGFDGKINLALLSSVMWPFAYLIALVFVSLLSRKQTDS
ncbi:MAG: hypothetical protein ACYTET_06720 [Planctomycetota bacterium]|jgi:hypothetical protein